MNKPRSPRPTPVTTALLVALLVPALSSPSRAQAPGTQAPVFIGVLDLEANNIEEAEAKAIADRLRYHLGNTGVFRVLERGRMENILKEVGFQLSGACDSEECVIQVGRILGVRKMVAGSVSRIGTIYALQVRLVDMETSSIDRQAIADVDGIEAVFSNGTLTVARQLAGLEGPAPTGAASIDESKPRRFLKVRESGWAGGIWTAVYSDREVTHQGITIGKLLGEPRLLYAGWFVSLASGAGGDGSASNELAFQTDLLRSPVLRPYLGIAHSKVTIAHPLGDDFEQLTGVTVGFFLHLKRLVLRFGTMPATGTGGSFGLLYDFSPAPRKTAIQESRRDE